MKKETLPEFMVIDDDPVNNLICHTIIQLTISEAVVQTFTDPEKGLDYIQSVYDGSDPKKAVLFLDINMPSISGWDVLDKLKSFPEAVKEQVTVYMLSSSVDPNDKEKAGNDNLVTGYIAKALSQVKLLELFPDHVKSA